MPPQGFDFTAKPPARVGGGITNETKQTMANIAEGMKAARGATRRSNQDDFFMGRRHTNTSAFVRLSAECEENEACCTNVKRKQSFMNVATQFFLYNFFPTGRDNMW